MIVEQQYITYWQALAAERLSPQVDDLMEEATFALETALLLSVPAAAGLIALDVPVIAVLFERGAFSTQAALKTCSQNSNINPIHGYNKRFFPILCHLKINLSLHLNFSFLPHENHRITQPRFRIQPHPGSIRQFQRKFTSSRHDQRIIFHFCRLSG